MLNVYYESKSRQKKGDNIWLKVFSLVAKICVTTVVGGTSGGGVALCGLAVSAASSLVTEFILAQELVLFLQSTKYIKFRPWIDE